MFAGDGPTAVSSVSGCVSQLMSSKERNRCNKGNVAVNDLRISASKIVLNCASKKKHKSLSSKHWFAG